MQSIIKILTLVVAVTLLTLNPETSWAGDRLKNQQLAKVFKKAPTMVKNKTAVKVYKLPKSHYLKEMGYSYYATSKAFPASVVVMDASKTPVFTLTANRRVEGRKGDIRAVMPWPQIEPTAQHGDLDSDGNCCRDGGDTGLPPMDPEPSPDPSPDCDPDTADDGCESPIDCDPDTADDGCESPSAFLGLSGGSDSENGFVQTISFE